MAGRLHPLPLPLTGRPSIGGETAPGTLTHLFWGGGDLPLTQISVHLALRLNCTVVILRPSLTSAYNVYR